MQILTYFNVSIRKLLAEGKKHFWKQNPVDDYWRAIENNFFSHVSNIVNAIKHDNRRLIFFALFNNDHSIPGHFVESVDALGRIIPDRKIHIPVRSSYDATKGFDTAFSFFRDLRYLFWGIYFVSHHLANAIHKIVGNSSNKSVGSEQGKTDVMICEIARRLQALPQRFYSDELKKDVPAVIVIEDNLDITLRLKYPDKDTILISGKGKYMATAIFTGDGVSRTWKFPYSTGGEL